MFTDALKEKETADGGAQAAKQGAKKGKAKKRPLIQEL